MKKGSEANPKRKAVPQGGIFDGLQYDLKLVLRHVKELLGRVVRHGVRDEIVRRDARLPPGGHEYEHGLGRGVRLDCCRIKGKKGRMKKGEGRRGKERRRGKEGIERDGA